MTGPKLLVAGNWKMNGLRDDLSQVEEVRAGAEDLTKVDLALFPPATLISLASSILQTSPIEVGAQDCHTSRSGAFTGDLSAVMLKDAGASAVILGHSERRSGHGETSRTVRAKAEAVLAAGMLAVVCVGETKGERALGLASAVCARQLTDSLPDAASPANTVIAYEPVWAIGSGVSPSSGDIAVIHRLLRSILQKRNDGVANQNWRILYGGSVTPENALDILQGTEVDGVLVGGASLKASSFLAIVAAAKEASERRKL